MSWWLGPLYISYLVLHSHKLTPNLETWNNNNHLLSLLASMGQEFENSLWVARVIEKQQCASSSALNSLMRLQSDVIWSNIQLRLHWDFKIHLWHHSHEELKSWFFCRWICPWSSLSVLTIWQLASTRASNLRKKSRNCKAFMTHAWKSFTITSFVFFWSHISALIQCGKGLHRAWISQV